MAAYLVLAVLLCSRLAAAEQTHETMQLRQIPFEIPLRLPMLVPGNGLVLDGPVALDGPEGGLVPVDEGSVPAPILDLMRALASGAARPRLPFPADGVRLKVKAGEGIPTPLQMEAVPGGVRIMGKLPSNLNSTMLDVKQLGHVVAVMYRMGEVGVEQRFSLDFEPEKVAQAKYLKATGAFELDVEEPAGATKPREVQIVFDESPAPKAVAEKKPKVEEKKAAAPVVASSSKSAATENTSKNTHMLGVTSAAKGQGFDNLRAKTLPKAHVAGQKLVKMTLHKSEALDNLKAHDVEKPIAAKKTDSHIVASVKSVAKGHADNLRSPTVPKLVTTKEGKDGKKNGGAAHRAHLPEPAVLIEIVG